MFSTAALLDEATTISKPVNSPRGRTAGDFRDWPAIDAWAAGIAAELETSGPRGQ
jgi:hypothetical protein